MNILVTGGTGSFGKAFIKYCLDNEKADKIIIYSRDEFKQYEMKKTFSDERLRYFIGDVRDKERLLRATNGVDLIVHAAALKQVDTIEYNPIEAIKTNVDGARNVIDAAIDNNVKQIVALSTDKAVHPINFYGGTKFLSDKLFQAANVYSRNHSLKCSVVRYGNVAGSRGSVIPFFKELKEKGCKTLPVTDPQMTRFYITLEQAVKLVNTAIESAKGGEILISKIPSFKITDLVKAFDCNYEIVGIRPGEKIHEVMITDSDICYDNGDHYRLYPNYSWYDVNQYATGHRIDNFIYDSGTNGNFLTVDELRSLI